MVTVEEFKKIKEDIENLNKRIIALETYNEVMKSNIRNILGKYEVTSVDELKTKFRDTRLLFNSKTEEIENLKKSLLVKISEIERGISE